jgi:uncharacterized protein YyaL (SSP411 family)
LSAAIFPPGCSRPSSAVVAPQNANDEVGDEESTVLSPNKAVPVAQQATAATAEAPPQPAADQRRRNRLANETSPYLLQHAENPVDWFPWGEEAIAKAKRENKLIFLSIGYSSCHWCHVMERESFTDDEIAAFMNDNFVCIKVDREERPDVDAIYMMGVQMMTGRGGWPLSVFLTPTGKPFFGGTYFPARDGDRPGAIGFLSIIRRVNETWEEKAVAVQQSADELTKLIVREMEGSDSTAPTDHELPSKVLLDKIQADMASQFDATYGGFGSTDSPQPKFPQTPNLFFLVDRVQRTNDADALKMLVISLDRMAMGGLRDHLGGGFHRYSVDRYWHIPHFEKMLYDNGQLASVYAEAFQITGEKEYELILTDMMEFLSREMTAPEGAFYSALDADSEHEEGKFYRWRRESWDEVLGREDAEVFAAVYAEQEQPNFEDAYYVPLLQTHWSELEQQDRFAGGRFHEVLAPQRQELLTARDVRVRPLTDTKILTSWNGMMIRGLADAGRVLQEPAYIERASKAARFLLENVRDKDGRLYRTYSAGEARLNAYVDDYANLVDGLLALYRATDDPQWLQLADELTRKQIELFWDDKNGGFFYTSRDHEVLIARGKQFIDNARPSGNSATASNLLYLAGKLQQDEYRNMAERTIRAAMPLMNRAPTAAPRMGVAIAAWLDGRVAGVEPQASPEYATGLVDSSKSLLEVLLRSR